MAHPKVIVLAMLSAATPGTACHLKHDLGEFFHGPFMWDVSGIHRSEYPQGSWLTERQMMSKGCVVISLSRYLDSMKPFSGSVSQDP